MADCRVHFEVNRNITGKSTVDLVGNRFVKQNSASVDGQPFDVVYASAAGRTFAVTGHDATAGNLVHLNRPGKILTIEAGTGGLAYDALVEVGANGTAVTRSAGFTVGRVTRAATVGNLAEIEYFASAVPAVAAS